MLPRIRFSLFIALALAIAVGLIALQSKQSHENAAELIPSSSAVPITAEATPLSAIQGFEDKPPQATTEELADTGGVSPNLPNAPADFVDGIPEPWDLAKTRPSDEAFYRIVDRMDQDSNYLAGVMQEFQSETDPNRLKWLAFMMGDLRDKPEITNLAGQMLFSGNEQSAHSALFLLSRLQQHDPAARGLVLQSLGASQEPTTIIASMNALGRVAKEISYSQKEQLLQQLTPLTQHNDTSVRRRSYELLFRWLSSDPFIHRTLSTGLKDSDHKVRRSTLIGFIDHPRSEVSVKLALMDVLNNTQEREQNRKLAQRALFKMELEPDERSHVQAIAKTF